jgi:hypothetical protein
MAMNDRPFRASRQRLPGMAVTIIAVLNSAFGGLVVLLCCYGLVEFAQWIAKVGPNGGGNPAVRIFVGALAILIEIVCVAFLLHGLVLGILLVVAGWGVITRRPWSRILTMALGSLFVLQVLLGCYVGLQQSVAQGLQEWVGWRVAKQTGNFLLPAALGYAALVFVVLLNRRCAEEFRSRKRLITLKS